jgi:hypothetical protein
MDLQADYILGTGQSRRGYKTRLYEPFGAPSGIERSMVIQVFIFYEPVRDVSRRFH